MGDWCFTRRQMKRITNNYGTVLGRGGFSVVYKGKLDNDRSVAVKKYNWRTQKKEFTKEVIIQSQCSHKNIVRLLGCCVEADAPILVTEFVPNGSLSDLIHGNIELLPVTLETRLQIAIDVAEALVYMHYFQNHPILHGDIKPSNILLGDKHVAKLCDFGISRLLCMDNDEYTGFVVGSKGYMDPVYCETGQLNPKCDVYSFGVVLLELITRKKGIDDQNRSLARMFARSSRDERRELFDKEIATDENTDFIEGIANLALDCLKSEIEDRPQMNEVLEQLRSIKRSEIKRSEILRQERRIMTLREIEIMLCESGFERFVTKASIDAIIGDPKQVSASEAFSGESNVTERAVGKVCMGQFKSTQVILIKISVEVDEGWKHIFFDEMIVQSRIKHWNVAKLFGCCLDHVDAPVLVYEYGDMGLHDVLFGNAWQSIQFPFTFKVRLEIAVCAAEGLAHLHSLDVVHGDVRAANVLVDVFSEHLEVEVARKDVFSAKIAGYGTPKLLSMDRAQYARFLTENVYYKDPQFLKTGLMAKENDVYGFGVVLVELFTQKRVQMHDTNTVLKKLDGLVARCHHLKEIKKLASCCLAPKVTERPTMAKVVQRLRAVLKYCQECLVCRPLTI
ncbi:wall-associated receptor kinase-like 9 isoform X2 [Oryza glaberrima]|uniref:wall-associated receptor kinase-like 9 isoform X2 n=1 Tax=Oryza glaberrima TaxID=4538 RepID=UPI00224C5E00|nr:wall-associated receptor kinase-like 9 isoform X2 [Oryza glaberrima]